MKVSISSPRPVCQSSSGPGFLKLPSHWPLSNFCLVTICIFWTGALFTFELFLHSCVFLAGPCGMFPFSLAMILPDCLPWFCRHPPTPRFRFRCLSSIFHGEHRCKEVFELLSLFLEHPFYLLPFVIVQLPSWLISYLCCVLIIFVSSQLPNPVRLDFSSLHALAGFVLFPALLNWALPWLCWLITMPSWFPFLNWGIYIKHIKESI